MRDQKLFLFLCASTIGATLSGCVVPEKAKEEIAKAFDSSNPTTGTTTPAPVTSTDPSPVTSPVPVVTPAPVVTPPVVSPTPVVSTDPIPHPPIVSCTPQQSPQECFNDRFTQPDATIVKKLDLLFVTDTSGSLDDERSKIATGITSFVKELPIDVDYQIAVMLSHGSTSTYAGKLFRAGTEPIVLSSKSLTLTQITTELKAKLMHTVSDGGSDGGEEGLYSSLKAVTVQKNLDDSRAKGFFRADSALVVIYISDEQDICFQYPSTIKPVYDPEKIEPMAFKRDCVVTDSKGKITQTLVSPQIVLDAFKSIQGDRPLLFGAIVYNNLKTVVYSGENEFGYGYMDLISLSKGISVDIASAEYDTGLSQIGKLTTAKLNLNYDFSLSQSNVDASTVKLSIDGASTTAFDYDGTTNKCHVPAPGTTHSQLIFNYCQKTHTLPLPDACLNPPVVVPPEVPPVVVTPPVVTPPVVTPPVVTPPVVTPPVTTPPVTNPPTTDPTPPVTTPPVTNPPTTDPTPVTNPPSPPTDTSGGPLPVSD